jgi:D-alanyl-D-alanine carboxypeptidase
MIHCILTIVKRCVLFSVILLSISACKKESAGQQPPQPVKSSQNQILSFAFLKADNPALSADLTGSISGNNISVTVPSGTPKTLIATFTKSDKSIVYLGTVIQHSDTTSNDFSNNITYKVIAEDGTTNSYILSVTYLKSSQKSFIAFSFLKANNSIASDVNGTIIGNQVTLVVPLGTNLTSLKPSFTSSVNSKILVNGNLQISGSSAEDFTSLITYRVTAEDGTYQDYAISVVPNIASIPAIDNAVANFMSLYNVPGLSIAVTKDDRLVYLKGYGMADVENSQPTNVHNLFRIMSCSKSITSITIMKLLDQGKIDLNSKVFGPGGILGNDYGTQPYGNYITDITVTELLHHTGGGWSNNVGDTDPIFSYPSLSTSQLITWGLDNVPLKNAPGTAFGYSSFGYCILGRVIEKVTGMTYENAVKSLILQPLGITDMKIAGNTLADRFPGEVKYYGQSGEDPYAYNVTRMDANGGWLATAEDIAKILTYIDKFSQRPGIISQNAINVMTTGSTANPYYGCGWFLNSQNNYWHGGSFPGASSEHAITFLGYNFVILTNTRNLSPNYPGDLDQVFWIAYPNVSNWPTYDLFH